MPSTKYWTRSFRRRRGTAQIDRSAPVEYSQCVPFSETEIQRCELVDSVAFNADGRPVDAQTRRAWSFRHAINYQHPGVTSSDGGIGPGWSSDAGRGRCRGRARAWFSGQGCAGVEDGTQLRLVSPRRPRDLFDA